MKKEVSMLEKEITMTRFLSIYFGVNPAIARHITHGDIKVLFSGLQVLTDKEFYKKIIREDMVNYIRVKDKNHAIMYYERPVIKENQVIENHMNIQECSDEEYNSDVLNFQMLLVSIKDVDLNKLEMWQLEELVQKLKKLKKYSGRLFDREIGNVNKHIKLKKKEKKK